MSDKGKKAEPKNIQPKRRPEQSKASAELSSSPEPLARSNQLENLPADPSARPLRQAALLRMQQQRGNAYVLRRLNRSSIQRKRYGSGHLPQSPHTPGWRVIGPVVQRGFFDDITSGIKSVGKAITSGAKAVGSAISSGAKAAGEALGGLKSEPSALIVDDGVEDLAPGQMTKSEFLVRLKKASASAADSVLEDTGYAAFVSIYLNSTFSRLSTVQAADLESWIHRYASETKGSSTAEAYLQPIAERVRKGISSWLSTGKVVEMPPVLSDLSAAASKATNNAPDEETVGLKVDETLRRQAEPLLVQRRLGVGRPLESATRARMERSFGRSFADISIHTDSQAVQLANQQDARAFTVGQHIAFNSGEYRPGTLVGDAILAHELAHSMQQNNASAAGLSIQRAESGYGSLEQDAEMSAAGAVASLWPGMRGKLAELAPNALPRLQSGLRIQRCDKPKTKEEEIKRIEADYKEMISRSRARGWDVAADNLEYYMSAKGGTRILEVKWLRSFDEILEGEKKNQKRFESTKNSKGESLNIIATSLKDGESATFTDHWDYLVEGDTSTELYYASGNSTITSTGTFKLSRKGDVVTITGKADHRWHDPYDWHEGLTAYIPGFGEVSDEDAILLKDNGRAKEFEMEAEWTQQLEGKIEISKLKVEYDWKEPK